MPIPEIECKKEIAIDYLRKYCEYISKGKITEAIFKSTKEIKNTLDNQVEDEVIFIECSLEDIDDGLSRRIRRALLNENIMVLAFLGREISIYDINRIKALFCDRIKPSMFFPRATIDKKIRFFLCPLKSSDEIRAQYDVDYATSLLFYLD